MGFRCFFENMVRRMVETMGFHGIFILIYIGIYGNIMVYNGKTLGFNGITMVYDGIILGLKGILMGIHEFHIVSW